MCRVFQPSTHYINLKCQNKQNICKRFTEQSFKTDEPLCCREPEVFKKLADIKTAKS